MSLMQSAYEVLPRRLQDAAVSLQGANFRWRRTSDRVIREHASYLLANEFTPADERRLILERQLAAHLRRQFIASPYGRQLSREFGVRPEMSEKDLLEVFSVLPLLRKADVRGSEDQFRVTDHGEPVSKGFTSGTTGSPTRLSETRSSFSKRMAHVARLRAWAGVDPFRPRRASFTGRPISNGKPPHLRRNLADNALLLSSVHLTHENASGYVQEIAAFRPVLMDGYPSALLMLARLEPRLRSRLPSLRALICTAETLTPGMHEELQDLYGVPVFNQYAMSESACFWSTCEAGSMHVHDEYGFAEVLKPDGSTALPGEVGSIVTTSFYNDAMPLIRYETGDLARLSKDGFTCQCGRTLPTVESVLGRTDDILWLPDRGFVGRLDPAFKGVTDLLEAQVRQVNLKVIELHLVVGPGWTSSDESHLVHSLRRRIGPRVAVDVHYRESIERGANGKFRSVISLCKDEYPSEYSDSYGHVE